MNKFNLGWGDPVCVREALFKYYIPHIKRTENVYSYITPEQRRVLEQHCRFLNNQLYNRNPKYIAIVVGAMQGINAGLDYYKKKKYTSVKTRGNYFPYYPEAAKRNNLIFNSKAKTAKQIYLVDSPSNPGGKIMQDPEFTRKVEGAIWDAAYNNPIYKKIETLPPNSEIIIGSFGKLFGLSGFRLGWVASDNPLIKEHCDHYTEINSCSLPTPSVVMINNLIPEYMEWGETYMKLAARYIDLNREEMEKVANIFDYQNVPKNGMFFFPKADKKARKILEKAGVLFVEGSRCGDKEAIRLNLAQNNDIIMKAVQAIKRSDKI